MKDLRERCDQFVLKIMRGDGLTLTTKEDFQKAYIRMQGWGAYRTAQSYWLLRDSGHNHDATILARTIFERCINASGAASGPDAAIDLFGQEVRGYIWQASKNA